MVAHGIAARKAELHAVEWKGDELAANVCSTGGAGAQPMPPSTQETLQPKIDAIQKEIDRRRQNDSKAAELLEADLKRVQI